MGIRREKMIDIGIFTEYYFTKYIIIATAVYGVFWIIRKLVKND